MLPNRAFVLEMCSWINTFQNTIKTIFIHITTSLHSYNTIPTNFNVIQPQPVFPIMISFPPGSSNSFFPQESYFVWFSLSMLIYLI